MLLPQKAVIFISGKVVSVLKNCLDFSYHQAKFEFLFSCTELLYWLSSQPTLFFRDCLIFLRSMSFMKNRRENSILANIFRGDMNNPDVFF